MTSQFTSSISYTYMGSCTPSVIFSYCCCDIAYRILLILTEPCLFQSRQYHLTCILYKMFVFYLHFQLLCWFSLFSWYRSLSVIWSRTTCSFIHMNTFWVQADIGTGILGRCDQIPNRCFATYILNLTSSNLVWEGSILCPFHPLTREDTRWAYCLLFWQFCLWILD